MAGPLAAALILPTGSDALAQSEAPSVDFLNGVWEGSYTCSRGLTRLRLDIQADSARDIDVVFSFSAHPTNPGSPSGRFRMRGEYEAAYSANVPSLIDLDATAWIDRPSGYATVDLLGTVSGVSRRITGSVDLEGCSTFEVAKLDNQQAELNPQNAIPPTAASRPVAQGSQPTPSGSASSGSASSGSASVGNGQLDGPESVVASFHQAIQNGNFDAVESYYCASERVAARALEAGTDPEGQRRALANAYLQVAYTIYTVDMSMLQYETVYTDNEGEGRAVVTVAGPVGVESANGQGILIPYRNFSALGKAWLRLIRENGEWKLCQNLES
ncbi:MAG: hypothetical protein ACFB0D_05735 [Phormidesmis sp.]